MAVSRFRYQVPDREATVVGEGFELSEVEGLFRSDLVYDDEDVQGQ